MTEALIEAIDAQTERSLRELGELEERVVGAVIPQRIGDVMVPWPWRALGRVRIVRRERGVLFATDGLAHPFDPEVHGPDREPLGFELGIEIANAETVRSSEELAGEWVIPALLWLAACYVQDDFQLLDLIGRFGMATQILPPDPILRHLVMDDGTVGALAGMPLAPTAVFGRESQKLLANVDGHESRLVVLTSLTPDECLWARAVPDGSRAMDLARALRASGNGHLTVPPRPSVLRGR